jgi:hypothetical protein
MLKTNTVYGNAKDMLLAAIADCEEKLAGQEHSRGYKFWKNIIDVMRYAYNHINETTYIYNENKSLRSYNNYLVGRVTWLENELGKYNVTKELIESGEIHTVLKRIESMGVVEKKDIEDHIEKLKGNANDQTK